MMRKRRFGTAHPAVSLIGQGTWKMETDSRAEVVATLNRGVDAGMTHVDTAELYGRGEVETILGDALASRRDELFLVSKVTPNHASYAGTLRACEASLKRLKTDRLDVYLLHWPGSHPLEETIRAFETLRESGKIRAWGVSNFDVGELEEAVAIAGPGKIACNQVLYHLEERGIEHRLIPWCKANDVAVVAYSPFGAGTFPSVQSAGGKVLSEIAATRDATPYQVALAFLVRDESVLTIPKATRQKHALDNAAAASLTLTTNELARIDRAFPLGRNRPLATS